MLYFEKEGFTDHEESQSSLFASSFSLLPALEKNGKHVTNFENTEQGTRNLLRFRSSSRSLAVVLLAHAVGGLTSHERDRTDVTDGAI